MDPLTWALIGLAVLAVIVVVLGGAIQTFRRHPIVAILCVIFLFPVWILWALIEVVLPGPD